jgi:hypothetical protein
MSSRPEGTKPTRGRPNGNETSQRSTLVDPETASAPLDSKERMRLLRLGYADKHVEELGPIQARQVLADGEPRPGSKAYQKKYSPALPSSMTDEGIAARTKGEPVQSAYVITSEFTNEVLRGADPISIKLKQWADANPGKRFRFLNPNLPPTAGTQFEMVKDPKTGGQVTVGDLVLGWMPEEIYHESYRIPNYERSKRMSGQGDAISEMSDAGETIRDADGNYRQASSEDLQYSRGAQVDRREADYAPMFGKGLTIGGPGGVVKSPEVAPRIR